MRHLILILLFSLRVAMPIALGSELPRYLLQFDDQLRAAAEAGRLDEVKALIEKGASLEEVDADGQSALTYAVRGDRLEVVGYLLSRGANPNRPSYANRQTPLGLAQEKKRESLVKLFEENNKLVTAHLEADGVVKDVFFETMNGDTPRLRQLLKTADVRLLYGEGLTLLRNAVVYGYPDLVKKLLSLGADPNACDNQGVTVAMLAAQQEDPTALRLLIDAGASPFGVDNAGRTPLMITATTGRVEAVKLLLKTGLSRVDYANDEGDTALSLFESELASLPADGPKRKALEDGIKLLREAGAKPVPIRHLRPFSKSGIKEVEEVPVQDLRAGGNENMRFALIGPQTEGTAPANGYKLLLLLPGGSASPEFHSFCTKIAHYSAGPDYLVAQLIAPVWSASQSKNLIWPTKLSPAEEMKFTTEEFVAQVVKDVKAKLKVDDRFVFALGYSSGGPPVYTVTLQPESPIRGAFVAMSIFQPNQLPTIAGAKGKTFYLLHSPEDFIPIAQAEQSRDELSKAGADVKLATYKGGHGWRDPVYKTIRSGLDFLEKTVGK